MSAHSSNSTSSVASLDFNQAENFQNVAYISSVLDVNITQTGLKANVKLTNRDTADEKQTSNGMNGVEEHAIVERNGKFYLLGSDSAQPSDKNRDQHVKVNSRGKSASQQQTAKHHSMHSESTHKTKYDATSKLSRSDMTFILTVEQKNQLASEWRERKLQEHEELKYKKELEQEKSKQNNLAFQARLKKKQQEKSVKIDLHRVVDLLQANHMMINIHLILG